MADVIVVGGGIHGCSVAFHLAQRGASVLLLEKDTLGRHASGVNAGGVRQIFRALPEVPLSVAAMALWERIAEIVDDDCGFVAHGHVFAAENDAELAKLKARRDELVSAGFDHEELIGPAELRRLVPALAGHCVGGLISRRDGAALPFHTLQAFRRQLTKLGVRIEERAAVSHIQRIDGVWRVGIANGRRDEAAILVNAAGAWAAMLAAQAGEQVQMQAIAPMLMISERMPPFILPVVSAVAAPLSFKQFPNGTVLIGGGYEGHADPVSNRTELDFRKLARNARTVFDLFPVMRGARIVRAWAGIEGRMSDGLPVIGRSSTEETLFHAFGFSAHGFQLGPIVGSIIAELIAEGSTALPIDAFSIRRFSAADGTETPITFQAGI